MIGARVYLGRIYTPLASGGFCDVPRGALAVTADGRIEDMGPAEEVLARRRGRAVVDFGEQLIVPGLVDCHQHICHFDWCRLIPDLLTWLREIYALEARFGDPAYAKATARRFFSTLIRQGTTSVCVHGPYFADAVDVAFATARDLGLRVIMGLNAGDRDLPETLARPAAASVADAVALCERWDGAGDGRLGYCFTVRPAYCASPALMQGMASAAAAAGARLQNHLSEDDEGQRVILGLFPGKTSDAQVYDEFGLLGPRAIMAHAIHLQAGDLELLGARGVAVAHCPRANLMAGGKQADLRSLARAGVRVGLGSDLGAGKGLSLLRVMEDALKVSPHLSIHDVMRMATLDGARVLGLDAEVGSLEVGKAADFLVVAPPILAEDEALRGDASVETRLASLVFCGDDRAIRHVVVGGVTLGGAASAPGHGS